MSKFIISSSLAIVSRVTLASGAAFVAVALVATGCFPRRLSRRRVYRQRHRCRSYRSLTLPRVQLEVEPTVAGENGKPQLYFPVGAKQVATQAAAIS